MKIIGIIFLIVGIAILIYVGYAFFQDQEQIRSPIPEQKGVKVIFVTPTE